MKLKVLLAICASLLSLPTSALELMKWERIPLQVPLNVGQERIVFVDKNVRVGFPPSLSGKLRIQSSGGSVYLSASEPFPSTRLQLQDVENGEVILLDISAVEGKNVREPVQVVYARRSLLSPRMMMQRLAEVVTKQAIHLPPVSQQIRLNGILPFLLSLFLSC